MFKKDFFALFNLKPSFKIDLKTLEKAYFKAQQDFHPDRQLNKTSSEKIEAIHKSMLLNEGYGVLRHPLKRAAHLLEIEQKDKTIQDADLLAEIFLLKEEKWNCKNFEQKKVFKSKIDDLMAKSFMDFEIAFDKQNKIEAHKQYLKLVYLEKIKNED